MGALTIFFGEEGLGKGNLATWIAARVTQGDLPGDLYGVPSGAEIFPFEDDAEEVLYGRLVANGANMDLIMIHDGNEGETSPIVLPDDLRELEAELKTRDSKLVVIDPLADARREGLNEHKNTDVRRAIVPLQKMASRLNLAVMGNLHPNKGNTSAANKISGSKAWRSVPRAANMLANDPDAPGSATKAGASPTCPDCLLGPAARCFPGDEPFCSMRRSDQGGGMSSAEWVQLTAVSSAMSRALAGGAEAAKQITGADFKNKSVTTKGER